MIDILTDSYAPDFGVSLINDNRQRASNWVALDNRQEFSQYGVKYYNYVFGTGQLDNISANALASLIQTELSANEIPCTIEISEKGMFVLKFEIGVL
jgi:hypothetical protein